MRIILHGFGVVGQSLTKLLESRSYDLYRLYGLKPRIVAIYDSTGCAIDKHGIDLSRILSIKKKYGTVGKYNNKSIGSCLLKDLEYDVLIEATPSNYEDAEPGITHIIDAMRCGIHVISVNKGPLAIAFPSLMETAIHNNVLLLFSGTVGGGTPILSYAKNSLYGEQILSFTGILNGTTNYILTKIENGMTFDMALDDARKKGYVESNESLDLDGIDAAAKLVILANWIMDMKVTLTDVDINGIRKITTNDIKNSTKKNCAIKLISSCDKKLSVDLKEISHDDPLCVDNTLNAISFTSEHSGTQTIIGHGAGGIETASSIIRDLVYVKWKIQSNEV